MTAAAPLAVDLAATVLVTLVVGPPDIPLGPEDTGGRGRWWLLQDAGPASFRGRDGTRGRAKRPPLPNRGFVPLGPDPRRTATGPVTFDAPLIPGCTYTLGVGRGNRLTLRVPDHVVDGATCTVDPRSPGEADVTWSIPSPDVPF